MRTWATASITASILLLLPAAAAHAKVIDVSGPWVIQMQSICAFRGAANVTQAGSQFSGDISVNAISGPSSCPQSMSASLSGLVRENQVEMGAIMGGQLGEASFSGTATADGILGGTFSVTRGQFTGNQGTWKAILGCTSSGTTLCIDNQPGDKRFEVKIQFTTRGSTADGNAIPLASLGVAHGGLFWFFAPDNPEALVKVLNACSLNSSFWVFTAAGTNVGLRITVRDTFTGQINLYTNPENHAALPIQDTSAFPCP